MASSPAESQKKSSRRLDPLDLYDVRCLLSEEERMVQDSVGALRRRERAADHPRRLREAHFPAGTGPRDRRRSGCFGTSLEGYGCAGMNAVSYGLICQELERGDSGLRSFVSVQSLAVHVPDLRLRQRGAEAALAAAHGARRSHRLLRPDRTARRLGPGQHEDARASAAAATGSSTARKMWITNAPIADCCDRLGEDRGRHPRLHRGDGQQGLRGAGDREQVLPARLGHRRAVLRRRASCRKRTCCPERRTASRARSPA